MGSMRTSALAYLAAATLLVGCGEEVTRSVTIGIVVDCQGGPNCDAVTQVGGEHWASIASYVEEAVARARSETNTLQDTELRVLIADSENDPAIAAQQAKRLVTEENAVALVAGSTNDDLAIHELFLDVPLACIFCSSPSINDPNAFHPDPVAQDALRNVDQQNFALGLSAIEQSFVLLRVALQGSKAPTADVNNDGVVKIAHIAPDEAFGKGVGDALEEAALRIIPGNCILFERVYHPTGLSLDHDFSPEIACLLDEAGQCPLYSAEDDNVSNGLGVTHVVVGDGCPKNIDVVPDLVLESTFPSYAAPVTVAYAKLSETLENAPPLLHFTSTRAPTILHAIASYPEDVAALFNHVEGVSFLTLERDAVGSDASPAAAFEERFLPDGYQDAMFHDAVAMTTLAVIKAGIEAPDTELLGTNVRAALRTLDEPEGTGILASTEDYARAFSLMKAGKPVNYDGLSGPCDFDVNWRVRQRMTHWRIERDSMTGRYSFVDVEIHNCVAASSCPVTP